MGKWEDEAEKREKNLAHRVGDMFNRAKDVVEARKCECGELAKPGRSTCGQC